MYVITEIRINDEGYPLIMQQAMTKSKSEAIELFNAWCEDFGATVVTNMKYGKEIFMRATGISYDGSKFAIELCSFYRI